MKIIGVGRGAPGECPKESSVCRPFSIVRPVEVLGKDRGPFPEKPGSGKNKTKIFKFLCPAQKNRPDFPGRLFRLRRF
jgi:hypothetical protein